jgi:acetyl esterase/lipase
LVLAPREAVPAQPRRVIAWTHGTWGLEDSCAPSTSPKFFEWTAATEAARRGYVVGAPDYPGLGSPGVHPFLVGTVTARSVLDAVRAARAIPGAAAGGRFAVWGESQGGHAALWTGQLARTDGAGLQLVGVAAGAPPTDLPANLRQASDQNAKAFFTSLIATSWSQYYGIPFRLGARRTPAIMQRLAGKCISVDSNPRLAALIGILALRQDLRRVDIAATPPWSSHAAANSVSPVSRVPVLIAQTRADPLVAPAVTRAFARRLCANRVRVRYIDLPGGDHPTTAKQSAPQTLQWIDDRFAGRPAPSDCGRI